MGSSSRQLLSPSTDSRVTISTASRFFPRAPTANDLGLVEAIERLGQGAVVAVSNASN
jgi:hypothetical protein